MDINELVISDEALNVIDNGAWVGDFDGAPGVELKVTGLQSSEAQKLLLQKQDLVRKVANKGKPLTREQQAECTKEVIHEVVLKDWRGLTDGGKPVKYSNALAKKWIMSRNGERLTHLCMIAANRIDAQAQNFVEVATKN